MSVENVPEQPDSEAPSTVSAVGQLVVEVRKEVTSLRREITTDSKDSPLLNREEAADHLRVSVRTLDDMAEAGEIQPVRIRGRVLYHTETLTAYIQRCAGEGRQ